MCARSKERCGETPTGSPVAGKQELWKACDVEPSHCKVDSPREEYVVGGPLFTTPDLQEKTKHRSLVQNKDSVGMAGR
jgi:hypothetical protein